MTMIARTVDGLPLVGTMQDNEEVKKRKFYKFFKNQQLVNFQSGKSMLEYQNQAKMLFKRLGPNSPARCTLETGPSYLFQYVIL